MRQVATKPRDVLVDPKQLRYVDDFVTAYTRLKTLFEQGDIDAATYTREMRRSREAIVEAVTSLIAHCSPHWRTEMKLGGQLGIASCTHY